MVQVVWARCTRKNRPLLCLKARTALNRRQCSSARTRHGMAQESMADTEEAPSLEVTRSPILAHVQHIGISSRCAAVSGLTIAVLQSRLEQTEHSLAAAEQKNAALEAQMAQMIAQMTMGQQMMALMREEIAAAAPTSIDEESSEVIRILRERNVQLEEQLGQSRSEMAALLESKEHEMMQMLQQLEGLDGAADSELQQ